VRGGSILEAKAVAKYIRVSPSKAKLVIDLIRGKKVREAEAILKFTPNRAAVPIYKVLRSATANAENNLSLNREDLVVTSAFIGQGPSMKRFKPRAMGRADRMLHRTCHITVVVGDREEV
jgi:large subunit ribosomal protein L22